MHNALSLGGLFDKCCITKYVYVQHFIRRVLILDEVDQLDSKNQEVLYTMFEWPALPKSRLILLGRRYNIVFGLTILLCNSKSDSSF